MSRSGSVVHVAHVQEHWGDLVLDGELQAIVVGDIESKLRGGRIGRVSCIESCGGFVVSDILLGVLKVFPHLVPRLRQLKSTGIHVNLQLRLILLGSGLEAPQHRTRRPEHHHLLRFRSSRSDRAPQLLEGWRVGCLAEQRLTLLQGAQPKDTLSKLPCSGLPSSVRFGALRIGLLDNLAGEIRCQSHRHRVPGRGECSNGLHLVRRTVRQLRSRIVGERHDGTRKGR